MPSLQNHYFRKKYGRAGEHHRDRCDDYVDVGEMVYREIAAEDPHEHPDTEGQA